LMLISGNLGNEDLVFEIVGLISMSLQREYGKGNEYDKASRMYYTVFENALQGLSIGQDVELKSLVKAIELCSN